MAYEFVGQDGVDQAGYSVSSAGDVDGDGQDDLLIGAPFADGVGNVESAAGGTYLINADDLATLDAADGITDGIIDLANVAATGTSYEFVGQDADDRSGSSVSSAGDVDGDGQDDLLIGAYLADGVGNAEGQSGSTFLIDAKDLEALDSADGNIDGIIHLGNVAVTGTSYEFVGEDFPDQSGISVSSAGDVDGDGQNDLLIGAQRADGDAGNIYLIDDDDLPALDAADGTSDGIINLANVAATGNSFKFVGEDGVDQAGYSVSSAGDVDGDGQDDLLIGARFADGVGNTDSNAGGTYLVNADDLTALDAADGTSDGIIDLGNVAATGTSYEFVGQDVSDAAGEAVSSAGDVDGDGQDDLLIGARIADGVGNAESNVGSTYLVNADDLAALDAADGMTDGIIDLANVAATGTSYEFVGEDADDLSGFSVGSAGDVDGDGQDDLLIGAIGADGLGNAESSAGSTYLVNADDLAALDAADGTSDGIIDLGNIAATGTSYEFIGQDAGDNAGYSVGSAGDVNGDGLDDLLIGARVADGVGNVENSSGSTYVITSDELAQHDAADGTVDGVIDLANVNCFLAGTRITTLSGEVPIETLQPGDLILTAEGRAVPVRFNFSQVISTRFGPPERLMPVRVRRGALGHGLPHRDLTLTSDHALLVDGLLITAGALVNETSIFWVPLEEFGDSYTVYHIETDVHDLLLADGTPAETFIDYVDRTSFDNYGEYVALYGHEPTLYERPEPRISARRLVPKALAARLAENEAA